LKLLTKASLTFFGGVEAAFMSSGLATELAEELKAELEREDGTELELELELELVEENIDEVENVVGRDDNVGTDGIKDDRALDGDAPGAPC
jgi:hypothetical protein